MPEAILFNPTQLLVAEGASLTFSLFIYGDRPGPISYSYSFNGGSALEGVDFTESFGGEAFSAATGVPPSETRELVLDTLRDTIDEGSETVTLNVSLEGFLFSNGLSSMNVPIQIVDDSPLTGRPTLIGNREVGAELRANIGGMVDADGITNVSYSWQFAGLGTLGGENSDTLDLRPDYAGQRFTVTVYYTGGNGLRESVTSRPTVAIREAPVQIDGTEFNDVLEGLKFDDRLRGFAMNDSLFGLDGGDLLLGGSGNDWLFGGAGDDQGYGGSGNDTLDGGEGRDRLVGGGGRDLFNGASGSDEMYGGGGDDRFFGGEGNDHFWGHKGRDRMSGDRGADTLNGGQGRDRIEGGRGDDEIRGGAGADRLVFRGDMGDDRVFGFDAEADRLRLDRSLLDGVFDPDEIVRQFSQVRNNDVILRFGDDGSLRLVGYLGDGVPLGSLADAIDVF